MIEIVIPFRRIQIQGKGTLTVNWSETWTAAIYNLAVLSIFLSKYIASTI